MVVIATWKAEMLRVGGERALRGTFDVGRKAK
jgi:hypothetical protein